MSWVELQPGVWDRGDGDEYLTPRAAADRFRDRTGVELPAFPSVATVTGRDDPNGPYLREFADLPPRLRAILSRLAVVKALPLAGTLRPAGCETLADILLDGHDGLVRRIERAAREARKVAGQYRDGSFEDFIAQARARGIVYARADDYPDRDSRDALVAGLYAAGDLAREVRARIPVRRGARPRWFWPVFWRDLHVEAGLTFETVALVCIAYEALPESLMHQSERLPGSTLRVYRLAGIVGAIRQAVHRA